MQILIRSRETIDQLPDYVIDRSYLLISIRDPNDSISLVTPKIQPFNIVRLEFHDIGGSCPKCPPGSNYTVYSPEMAVEVANAIHSLPKTNVRIIVCQCEAGISRSAGMAMAMMESFGQDSSVIWNNRRYFPNHWVYRLTLDALNGDTIID